MQAEMIYLQQAITHLKHKYDELGQDAEIATTSSFLRLQQQTQV